MAASSISQDAQVVLKDASQEARDYAVQHAPGKVLTSGEAKRLIAAFKPAVPTGPTPGESILSQMQKLGSEQYQFDPNQFLPGIQQQAESIYTPQQQQLEAIRQLQQASYEDQKVQSEKDFEKRMRQEQEAINRRGAFFSGGAIQNEQDLRSQFQSQEFQKSLQYAASQYSLQTQQAMLQADKTKFIQDQLYNSEASAYSRWTDQRNFSMAALQSQYQVYANERDFARSVFESDRQYSLQQKELKLREKQFKMQYKLDEARFKMAKEEFNFNMKVKKMDYEQAMNSFKGKYDTQDYFPNLGNYKSEWNASNGGTSSGGGLSFGF